MFKLKCLKCGKKIEGYTLNHVEHLMQQHELKHQREGKNERANKSEIKHVEK